MLTQFKPTAGQRKIKRDKSHEDRLQSPQTTYQLLGFFTKLLKAILPASPPRS